MFGQMKRLLTFVYFEKNIRKMLSKSPIIPKYFTKSNAKLKDHVANKELKNSKSLWLYACFMCRGKRKVCYINSTFSMHMTGKINFLHEYKLSPKGGYVTFRNNSNSIIQGYGILVIGIFTISNVSYVVGFKHNLISVAHHIVEFWNKHIYIITKNRSKCLI